MRIEASQGTKPFIHVTSMTLHSNRGGDIFKASIFLGAYKVPGAALMCFTNTTSFMSTAAMR